MRRIAGSASVPNIVFIMTGINNLVMDDYGILADYEIILRSLKLAYPSAVIVVQSVLPVMMWTDNAKIEEINHALTGLADRLTISFLDIYSSFLDPTGSAREDCLDEDGVHLSSKGYEVWSAKVTEFLNHLQQKSSS